MIVLTEWVTWNLDMHVAAILNCSPRTSLSNFLPVNHCFGIVSTAWKSKSRKKVTNFHDREGSSVQVQPIIFGLSFPSLASLFRPINTATKAVLFCPATGFDACSFLIRASRLQSVYLYTVKKLIFSQPTRPGDTDYPALWNKHQT